MLKSIALVCFTFLIFIANAQNTSTPFYKPEQIKLPDELQKQVCISGMVYQKSSLVMASERCPVVIIIDSQAYNLRTINYKLIGEFEVEGISFWKNNMLLVSENPAAVYSLSDSGKITQLSTNTPLPGKLKTGDGLEGIATNEKNELIYLLRERNEKATHAQIMTCTFDEANNMLNILSEKTIRLPLENADWRYSDIFYDTVNRQLLCLKSYAKGKTRKHRIDAIKTDEKGNLAIASLTTLVPEGFSTIISKNKSEKLSLNFEGLTLDEYGNIYLVSDNTSGQANCGQISKEKTVLLKLVKQN